MRILTAQQMRAAEAAAVAAGGSYEGLMENAGTAAAAEIAALPGLPQSPGLLLLCGKGNNAGDAFVIARLLAEKGWRCQVLLLCGRGLSPLAELNRGRLPGTVAQVGAEEADWKADVLVDGVFGTGFAGSLPPAVQTAFARANAARGMRVALDLPSGLNCDTGEVSPGTFRAALTLTFGAYKPALVMPGKQAVCGEIRCLDIGL